MCPSSRSNPNTWFIYPAPIICCFISTYYVTNRERLSSILVGLLYSIDRSSQHRKYENVYVCSSRHQHWQTQRVLIHAARSTFAAALFIPTHRVHTNRKHVYTIVQLKHARQRSHAIKWQCNWIDFARCGTLHDARARVVCQFYTVRKLIVCAGALLPLSANNRKSEVTYGVTHNATARWLLVCSGSWWKCCGVRSIKSRDEYVRVCVCIWHLHTHGPSGPAGYLFN